MSDQKLSRLEGRVLAELHEAGAEHVTVLANTIRPSSKEEFIAAVESLVRRQLAEWGDGEVRDGHYSYFPVSAPGWERFLRDDERFSWDGVPPLLMLVETARS